MMAFSLLLLCSFLLLIVLSSTLGFFSIWSCSTISTIPCGQVKGRLSDTASHYGNCSPLASCGQVLPPGLYYFQAPFFTLLLVTPAWTCHYGTAQPIPDGPGECCVLGALHCNTVLRHILCHIKY